jgi:homoserine kinase
VPSGERNIIFVAARTLFSFLGHDVSFRLDAWNDIPHSRGLGSSSAARVGGLVAANEWARTRSWNTASSEDLLNLATELEGHPDNAAAALLGGLTVSGTVENGGRKTANALQFPVARWPYFAVWIPDAELPTSQARAALPATVPHHDAVFNLSRTALLLACLAKGEWSALPDALDDRLHQPQRASLIPDWPVIERAATASGALATTISGAGSTLLLWLPDEASRTRAVDAVKVAAQENNLSGRVLALEVDERGARVVE